MISIYQFSGMMQNLSDHLALSVTGHPGSQLVIEELADCIHTSFYFDDEEIKNKLIAHQEKSKPACSMCSSENRLTGREPNKNLIEKLYCTNPAGIFALRRYRGEGNNRISNDKNILVASTAATNNALNSGNTHSGYNQLWKNIDTLSRIKWEVNILTREDLEYFGYSTTKINLFPSENNIIEALKTSLTENQTHLGNCAETVLKILSKAQIPINCYLTRPGSILSACADIASRQSNLLLEKYNINEISAIRKYCLRNYSLAACMEQFLSNQQDNERQINEYKENQNRNCKNNRNDITVDLSCYLPSMDDWLFKLYGELRGVRLVGIDGYRQIDSLSRFYSCIKGEPIQEPFKQNLTTRLANVGVSLP